MALFKRSAASARETFARFRGRIDLMPEGYGLDLLGTSATDTGTGVIWALGGSDDLNANLVRFAAGGGVEEHVNEEVDVLFVGVAGSGFVSVEGRGHTLSNGALVFVPKGARRSTRATSDDFSYLTVHRRRGPLRIGA